MVVRDNGQSAKEVSGCKYQTRNTELPTPRLQCGNHTTRPSTHGWCSLHNWLSYCQGDSLRMPAHRELRGSMRG